MVIAELSLSIEDGSEPKACKITMHAPEDTDGMWICRYTIEWPAAPEESFGAGLDAFQALDLTLQKIGIAPMRAPITRQASWCSTSPGEATASPCRRTGAIF